MLALASLALGAASVRRAGYSADEELTWFAVHGIQASGLPRLPSGTVYDRGLAYSYMAWASAKVFGVSTMAERLPSLIGGALVVVLATLLAERLGGSGVFAGVLCCGASWLVMASSWARFYSLFAAGFLATALLGLRRRPLQPIPFLAALAATRLLHELALALVAVPLFFWLEAPQASPDRARYRRLFLLSLLTVACLQGLLYALPGDAERSLASISADAEAMPQVVPAFWASLSRASVLIVAAGALLAGALLRSLGAPGVFCAGAAACVATLNVGLLAAGVLGWLLVSPGRPARTLGWGALAATVAVLIWSCEAVAATDAGFTTQLAGSVLSAGTAVPTDAFWYVTTHWPLALAAAGLGIFLGSRRVEVRAMAFLALAALAFLGTLGIAPTPRYFVNLFPLGFCLATIPIRVLGGSPPWRRAALSLALGAALLAEHEFGGRDSPLVEESSVGLSRLRTAPADRWRGALSSLDPAAPRVCNDDLGCLMAGQPPTYWWLDAESDASTYGWWDGRTWRSTYTGVPILVGAAGLAEGIRSGRLDGALYLLLDTPKYASEEMETALAAAARRPPRLAGGTEGLRLLKLDCDSQEEETPCRTEQR